MVFLSALGLLLALAFLSKYQSYFFALALFVAFLIWRRKFSSIQIFISEHNFSLWTSSCYYLEYRKHFDSLSFHQTRSSFTFDIFHAVNSTLLQSLFMLPTTAILIGVSLVNYIQT